MRILTLPEGLDPCDFLHQQGAEAFRNLLEMQTVDALDHAFQNVTRGVDVDRDVHAASQALERLVSIVAKAPRLRANTSNEDRFREEKILPADGREVPHRRAGSAGAFDGAAAQGAKPGVNAALAS